MVTVLQVVFPLCVFLLVVKLFPALREFWRTYRMTRDIPGPTVYPLIGSFHVLAGPVEGLFDKFAGLWLQYGAVFKVWIANMCFVVLTDPADLEVVFTAPHLQSKMEKCYNSVRPMLGVGLLSVNKMKDYRRRRKAITSTMHFEILQDFVHSFVANAERMALRLQPFADSGEVFNVLPHMGHCANHNMCETILSTDVAGMEEKRDLYVAQICKASKMMLWKAMRPWYWSDSIFRLLSRNYKEYHGVARILHGYVEEVLEMKLRQAKEGKVKPVDREKETFLEKFLRSEESSTFNEKELVDEIKGLMFAASDTTVQLVSFFLVIMSIHCDIQQNVYKELQEIFGSDCTRSVEMADLPRMQYLECVLKEVLRMFPVAPLFGREATADVTLPSGYIIPKGCNVIIYPHVIHRNERWFPDPLKFDPNRFLPENTRGRHPYAYVPFSAGSRSCLGQKYGMMFVKTVASTLLKKFSVLPDPNGPNTLRNLNVTIGITMCMTEGANIRLRNRD